MADIATLNGVAIADIAALNGVLKGSVDTVNGITRTPVLTGYTADQIPTMTSNTAPSGTASASSILSGTYAAFKAMDGVTAGDQGWASSSVAAWLQYEFTATKQIERYTMQMSTLGSSQFPTAWTFEGYNGSTWDVLTHNPAFLGRLMRKRHSRLPMPLHIQNTGLILRPIMGIRHRITSRRSK